MADVIFEPLPFHNPTVNEFNPAARSE